MRTLWRRLRAGWVTLTASDSGDAIYLQVARVGLLVVLLGSGWAARRRRRGSTVGRAD